MYPMPTVEPTCKLILLMVKALLKEDAPAKAVLAAIEAMELTITEAEEGRRALEETFNRVKPFFRVNADGDEVST